MSGALQSQILAAVEKAHSENPRKKVEVPEWGVDLYFPTILPVSRRRQIMAGIDPDDMDMFGINLILHQAEDEAGEKAFDQNNLIQARAALEGKANLDILQQIVSQIWAPETKDQAKNDFAAVEKT